MKTKILLIIALLTFGPLVMAQKYTDEEINFNREELIKELQEHESLQTDDLESQLRKIRNELIRIHEHELQNIAKNQSRMNIPILNTGCANMDFSNHTNSWTYHWSKNNYGTRPSQNLGADAQYGNNSDVIVDMDGDVRFEVLPANTFDPNFGQAVNPNAALGEQVLLLGRREELPPLNNETSFRGQEEVSKSFTVSEDNAVLQYGYAIAFENPNHIDPNSFEIFIEVNGVPLAGCETISFTFDDASDGNGFVPSALDANDRVRQWTTNTIDLIGNPNINLGDIVTISFRNRDCSFGGHGSYAYVSAQCLSLENAIEVESPSGNNCTNESIAFTANVDVPANATTQWVISQGTAIIGVFNNTTTISQVFTQPGNYTVTFTLNSPGGGCSLSNTINITVVECCDSSLPLNIGFNNSQLRRVNDVVVNTNGDFYVLFDRLAQESGQFDGLVNEDFVNSLFLLKFNEQQCLVDYIEISNTIGAYGNLEIDAFDNLYVHVIVDGLFVKLNQDLQVLFSHELWGHVNNHAGNNTSNGNIDSEDVQGLVSPLNSHLAYSHRSAAAEINGIPVLDQFPNPNEGPLVALVNKLTGIPFSPYAFDISNFENTVSRPEVTRNALYLSVRFFSKEAGSFSFAGTNYSYSSGFTNFIAKFDITTINTALVPAELILTGSHYTNLEFNENDDLLYVGNSSEIRTFDEDLNDQNVDVVIDSDGLSDLVYDYSSQVLAATMVASPSRPVHLRLFTTNLQEIGQLSESLNSFGSGIFNPRIARRGDIIYLTGIYNTTVPLQNGLPASTGFDLYVEAIDATVIPPAPSPFTRDAGGTFTVYPNPSDGVVNITSLTRQSDEKVSIRILNDQHEVVFKQAGNLDKLKQLDLSKLKNGLYLLEIINERKEKEVHRLIIKK